MQTMNHSVDIGKEKKRNYDGEYFEVRCPKCNGLLFKKGSGFHGPVEIKCGKCKGKIAIH